MYVGSDVEGSIASSTNETTIATVVIPANTVSTGIIAEANCGGKGAGNTSIIKLKIGATSSEALKQTINLVQTASNSDYVTAPVLFYDSTQTWTNEVTVLITGTNGTGGASDQTICWQLVVKGY